MGKVEEKKKRSFCSSLQKITNKKKFLIGIVLLILTVILVSILINVNRRNSFIDQELARTMTYDIVQEGDENVEGTDFVKFDAFFLRDLNGDGYAEGVRGTCKQIGKQDILYMDIKVQGNGYLKDGKITINSNNMYFETAIPKDNEIKENAIGNNVKEILFNNLNTGTQRLLTGTVKSGNYAYEYEKTIALGNNINNYNKVNSITFSGIHVADDNTETKIEKTVDFNIDWYATVSAEIANHFGSDDFDYVNQEQKIDSMIDEENNEINLKFSVLMRENKGEAFLSKAQIEMDVPNLNGYDPIRVEVKDADYNYDELTKKLVASKIASVDENGKITKNIYQFAENKRYTKFDVTVTYSLEAYKTIGAESVEAQFKTKAFYEGFNNPNEEFNNPYKSNVATNTINIAFRTMIAGEGARIDVYTGKFVYNPQRYIVSKENALKIYDGISTKATENYEVLWCLQNGYKSEHEMRKTVVKEETSDLLVKNDGTEVSMQDMLSNVGIYFTNCDMGLYDDGYIKLYNDDTDELIETFTKENWNKYTKINPYRYSEPIKHVRIEVSDMKAKSQVRVYNVKELNDEYIVENYSREEFGEFTNIKSAVLCDINDEYFGRTVHSANYEAKSSLARLTMDKTSLSTQITEKNTEIKIITETSSYDNREKWKNGIFLLKLPKEIIDLEILETNISSSNVNIISIESYEEEEDRFIKIITENETPASYEISIKCNITPDPRVMTTLKKIQLYASNENCKNYLNRGKDIYDINDNLNTEEYVNLTDIQLNLISPGTLLTNQIAKNYDNSGSIAIAPQHAIISKNQRTATVELEVKNGYVNTISDIVVLGKIPMKGNTYAISNGDMKSDFDTQIVNGGIYVPEEIKDNVSVYYSEKGEPTKDILDENNGWIKEPQDWSKIRSYLIVFEDYSMAPGTAYKFNYEIMIPEELNYNDVSYSHHGVYFSLDTEEGKYRTYVEPNKLGFMIAKQFDLEITKYQKDSEKLVPQATYLLIAEGEEEEKSRVTNLDGKITLKNLFVNKTYIVKEIKSSSQYELNPDEIKFKVIENSEGKLEAILISGTLKEGTNLAVVEKNSRATVLLVVEDKVRPNVKVITNELGTDIKLANVRYKLTGKGLVESGKTVIADNNGELTVNGLYTDEEYVLEEVKADGYYLTKIKFVIRNNNGVYEALVTEGTARENRVTINDEIPTINLSLDNEKIPTYTLDITKTDKGQTTVLAGAKFKLLKDGNILGEYISDENGKIVIPNLYQYVDGKDLDCTYTLKETFAPEGYAKIKDVTFNVKKVDGKLEFNEELLEGQTQKTYTSNENVVNLIIEDSPSFKLIKKDGTTAEILPGVKFAIYNVDNGEMPARDSKGNLLGTKEIIDGREYYVVLTNENGEITADLPEGLYKAIEVQADDKYDINDNEYYFGIGVSRDAESNLNVELFEHIGDSENDYIKSMSNTMDGGTVVGGHFRGTIILKNGEKLTAIEEDGFVIKYDVNGNIQWYKQLGSTGNDQVQVVLGTSDGGVAVGFRRINSVNTMENGYVTSNNGVLLLKYDVDGNLEWLQDTEASAQWTHVDSIAETVNREIVIGLHWCYKLKLGNGEYVSGGQGYDAILIKYSETGNFEWYYHFDISTGFGNIDSIVGTKDGGIVITVGFTSAITINDSTQLEAEDIDGMIIKYNSDGEIEWYKHLSLSGVQDAIADYGMKTRTLETVEETSDGGILVGGIFRKSLTLDNGEVLTSVGGIDALLLKYSESGDLEWYKQVGGTGDDWIYSIKEATDGGIIAVGNFSKELRTTAENAVSAYNTDGMVIKYTKDGEEEWFKQITGPDTINIYSLTEKDNGDILLAGFFYNTIIFNNSEKIKTKGKADGVILKLAWEETPDIISKKINSVGGNLADTIQTTIETADGGMLVGGNFRNSITLNNGEEINPIILNNQYGLILKYAKDGSIEWYKQLKASQSGINSIIETQDGGIVVVGYFNSGVGEFTLENGDKVNSNRMNNGIILKYNKDQELEWYKHIKGQTNSMYSVTETTDGGILVGGEFNGSIVLENIETVMSVKDTDGIILKYTKDGELEYYRKEQGAGYDTIRSIVETKDGGIVTGGYFRESLTLSNGDVVTATAGYAGLIVKYNKEGKIQWYKQLGGTGVYDYIYSVSATSDGGIIAGGSFKGNTTLDNGDEIFAMDIDGIILKYSQDGNLEWHKEIVERTGDSIYSVKETKDGGILAGGKIGVYNSVKNEWTMKGLLAKYTLNGNLEWKKTIGSNINSVAETADGSVVVGGEYSESIVDENGNTITSKGNTDALVAKMQAEMGVPEVQELEVKNYLKEFKITTKVQETNGVKGGTISGEGQTNYETVTYGNTNTKEIKIIPNSEYEITDISVNGEKVEFETLEDGSYIMPQFVNVQENKNIVVTFAMKDRKITINKIDSITKEALAGVKFKIEQVDDTLETSELYTTIVETNNKGQAITEIPFGKYNITEIKTPEGYIENNEALQIDFSSEGVHEFTIENSPKINVVVHHYLKDRDGNKTTIELAKEDKIEGKTGEKYTTTPRLDLAKYELEKDIDGNYILPEDSTGIFGTENQEVNYYYVEKKIPVTVHHYIEGTLNPVPLADGSEAKDVIIENYSGETYITEAISNDLLSDKYELAEVTENNQGTYGEYPIEVIYYYKEIYRNIKIIAYTEDGKTLLAGAKFTIVNENDDSDIKIINETIYETDINGTIEVKLPVGKYIITEIDVPEGFELPENTTQEIEINRNTEKQLIVATINERIKGNVIIHHYIAIEKEDGTIEYSTEKVPLQDGTKAEDEYKSGYVGNTYITKENSNISDRYMLMVSPNNSSGEYIEGDIEVTYYYKLRKYDYKVEYYYNDVKDESKTDIITAIYKDNITEYVDKNIRGYKLDRTENLPLTISEKVEENLIKVYYIIDEDNTKELSYTVEYYKEGTKVEEDTQIVSKTVQVLQPDTLTVDKTSINTTDKYFGYKLGKTEPSSIPDTVNNGDVIKVYYVIDEENIKELSYTVEYYKEGTVVEADTQTVKQTVQVLEPDTLEVNKEEINTVDKYFGYKLEKTEPGQILDTVNNGEVIKVYYVIDENNTKELSYTVEYYKEGTKVEEDTQTVKQTVQVLEADTLTVDKTSINLVDKYFGYKLGKTEPSSIPDTINNGDVIKVYYVIDENNTKELSYTVEYHKEGTKVEEDTQIVKETVQVLQPDILTVDKTSINLVDKYFGYKLEKTEPSSIPDTVNNGDVIKVYYIIDEENTKELSYTVEYYKEGTVVEEDTQTVKQTVQILNADTLTVDKTSINLVDKYFGYKLEKTEPSSIPDTVNNGDVIKVYYVIDENNTKELSYTVEYHKEGTKVEEDTQIVKETVQVLQPDILTVDKTSINLVDKYFGYKLEKTEPSSIPDTVNNGDVIKVYYIIDEENIKELSYTVEYYKEGTKVEEDTQIVKETVQVLEPDTLIVDKTSINLVDKYFGYKLEKTEPSSIPDTVNNGDVIKVYYIIDEENTKELSYTVEYYKEGTKVEEDTQTVKQTVQILDADTLTVDKTSINLVDKYFGYKLEKTEPSSIPDTVNNGDVIKVYYIIDEENIKELSYTVEYYKEGTVVEEDTQIVKETVQVLEPDTLIVDKTSINLVDKYFGYKLEKTEPSSIPDTVNNGDIIKVYYVIDEENTKELSYTVEYYKEGTVVEEDTQTVKQTVQILDADTLTVDKTSINLVDKYFGYKLEKTEPSSIPDTVNNGDVIKVYYVIDENNTKELSYTVEYHKEGTKVEEDTQTVKQTVQILDADTLTVDKTSINLVDKYFGYKLEKTEPSNIPDTINNGDVIKLYYVIDEDNTKELSYTVEYYKEGIKVEEDTQIVKETVQVLEPDTLEVNKEEINTVDKYFGYKLEKTEPSSIPDTINNGDVIKVYYVIDEDNTKDLSYTVEYYKEGIKVEEDTQIVSTTVQVLQPDTLEVNKEEINTVDKYFGHKLEKTEPSSIPDTINNGDVIKVYYVIDEDNTKDLSYTVEYYKEGIKVEEDTQIVSTTVQVLQPDTLEVNKEEINTIDKYYGYKLEKTEPSNIPDKVNDGDVIKVYYIIDDGNTKELSYTVEYYKDGIKVDADTQIVKQTVQILDADTLIVDKTAINITDKYFGYKLEKTEPISIPDTVNDGEVIKVYYIIDEENTKELSYTVEYYKEGTVVEEDTQTVKQTVQVLEADTLTVDRTSINLVDKYYGYKLEKTEPSNIPDTINNGDVIKVYYVIDEENTKELNYTVEYYKEGTVVEEDTQIVSTTVQILQPDILTVDKASINTVDKYFGYKLEKTEPSSIPDTINNGDVIKVYYVIDENNTKELSYTVEYYKEGLKVEEDTQIVSTTVQVLEPDILTVDKTSINLVDKYFGYKLEKTEPSSIPDTINNGEVIKVYYMIDADNTKDLSYTVEYYKEGTKVDADTQVVKETVQVLQPNTLMVDKTSINITDKYFGYKLEKTEPSSIPDTVNDGDVIKVYYVIDENNTKELSYTVEYYREGIKVEEDTQTVKQTVQVLEADTLTVDRTSINLVDKYYGYKLEKTEPEQILDIVNDGDVIKVYYVIDEDNTKELSYSVEYYKEGLKVEEDTQTVKQIVQVLNQDTLVVDKASINLVDKYFGYKLEKTEPSGIPDTINNGDVIKVYYVIDEDNTKDLSYTVEYYREGTKIEEDTQIVKETVQVLEPDILIVDKTSINITDKYFGYKLEKTEPNSISDTINNGDVIKVYYVIDEDNTKELSYTVEYYKEGTKVEEDTQTVKETVQVLQSDILTVDKTSINTVDKYFGYKLEKTEPSNIPDTVNNGDVIKVYYVIDEENTKELSYTVEYYREGIKVEEDTQIVSTTVQVLQPDRLEVNKEEINVVDKYFGYKLEKTEPSNIPDTINNGDIIKVYYIIDEENTKELSYTVEYYKEGTVVEEDTQTVKQTVQVLEADTLAVDKTSINLVDKYFGYKLEKTEPSNIPDTINNGEVIKVYYMIDADNTKDLSYTVEYYKEGLKFEEDTQIIKETVQILHPDTLTVDKTSINLVDKYFGYKLEKTEPDQIPNTVNNGDVIKVYYVIDEDNTKDLSYTVEYYKEGTKVEEDTQIVTSTAQILQPDALAVDKTTINIIDKYVGYKLESIKQNDNTITDIPDTVDSGTVIKIYYVKDEFDYTVEYYYDNVKDESKTETAKAKYQEVIEDYIDKNIVGYKLEKTEGLPLVISELSGTNVIRVYYVKDTFNYTVEYYYDEVKDEEKTDNLSATYGEEITTYTEKLKDGYKFDKVENLPLIVTENLENNVIKVYYTRKDAIVTVKYLDKATEQEISNETIKTGKVFDKYDVTEDEKEVEGYTLIERPNPTTGEFTEENQIKIYYYARNTEVVVRYVEKDTNLELLESKTIAGYEGKEYSTTKEEIENYTFVESTENTEGIMTIEPIEVIYYYAQNTKATVNYIDRETDEILYTETEEGKVGDIFETEAKDFEGYVLVEEPVQKVVTMTKEEIVLNYYYAHISSGVIEKHIDVMTGEILDNKTYMGNEGDVYKTTSKTFEGYDLVEERLPENAEGIMTIEVIEVKYYYIRQAEVIVNYIDVITGKHLEEIERKEVEDQDGNIKVEETLKDSTEVILGHEGDNYTTTEKAFEGYIIVKEKYPTNSEGIMKVSIDDAGKVNTTIIVDYYYVHISGGVIENHIDVKTNEIIETKIYEGNEGDPYKTEEKVFEGYDLVKEQYPNNSEGYMTIDNVEVNYYYIRKAKVVVEYIDKNTGETLKELDKQTGAEKDSTEIIIGHEGDMYTTKEKAFDSYVIVKEEYPENAQGEMTVIRKADGTVENITYVRYYYVYEKATVVEKHIDAITGEVLDLGTTYEGNEGDPYATKPKEIEGYDIVEEKLPGNSEGTMSKEEIEVRYYYIKKTKVIVEYIDKKTGNKLTEDVVINGHEGDNYMSENKNFEGYDFVEKTDNTSGKMTREDIVVKYYYDKKPEEIVVKVPENPQPENTEKPSKPADNNNNNKPINTPNTGDNLPVIAIGTISLVIFINILQIIILKIKKKKQDR